MPEPARRGKPSTRRNPSFVPFCGTAVPSSGRRTLLLLSVFKPRGTSWRRASIHNNNNNETQQLRDEWRTLWKEGRLLTDRTELLAVYPSDSLVGSGNSNNENGHHHNNNDAAARKRGGFADLLHLYTDRLVAVLRDEQEDAVRLLDQSNNKSIPAGGRLIVEWLEGNYGKAETDALHHDNFRLLSDTEQLAKLKHFLEWFRSLFPYYYDRCGSCGASIKEDSAAAQASQHADEHTNSNESKEADDENSDDDKDDGDLEHQTFIGYVYPDRDELVGKASRTELYQCHVCHNFTRFPRFNSARHVMDSRRGRCGEYSMLLFRFLRALHHECRWVVDWADHVWAEVLLQPAKEEGQRQQQPPRWIHLDPCEAAVDENLIYQAWGKKQTFVLGFYLPPVLRGTASLTDDEATFMLEDDRWGSADVSSVNGSRKPFAMIEDITQAYTSDLWDDICKRREETQEQVESAIKSAIQELQGMLVKHEESVKNNTMTTAI